MCTNLVVSNIHGLLTKIQNSRHFKKRPIFFFIFKDFSSICQIFRGFSRLCEPLVRGQAYGNVVRYEFNCSSYGDILHVCGGNTKSSAYTRGVGGTHVITTQGRTTLLSSLIWLCWTKSDSLRKKLYRVLQRSCAVGGILRRSALFTVWSWPRTRTRAANPWGNWRKPQIFKGISCHCPWWVSESLLMNLKREWNHFF